MIKPTKSKTNKIIILVVIIMMCNFIMPNYSHAGIVEDWIVNPILTAFARLLLTIPDALFSGLQGIFLGDSSIETTDADGNNTTYYIKFAPGAIFAGRIPMFDINFISPDSSSSLAGKLQITIATWYRVMRDVSLVGLLSILVYIAIRIIMSSATRDRAKYKKMLGNWFAAICLLFVLHFMMSLVFTATRSNN